jgi:hypothetical protein
MFIFAFRNASFQIIIFDLFVGGARPRIARTQWWPPAVPLAPRQENSSHTLFFLHADAPVAIVADPGCLSWIRIFSISDTGSRIQAVKKAPEPGSGFATLN